MKKIKSFSLLLFCFINLYSFAQDTAYVHPDIKAKGWKDMFSKGLSNGIFPAGVWSSTDGVITATKDEAIWSKEEYDDFVLDLDFKMLTAPTAVLLYMLLILLNGYLILLRYRLQTTTQKNGARHPLPGNVVPYLATRLQPINH